MAARWRNWAGDQRCEPAAIERPANPRGAGRGRPPRGRARPAGARLGRPGTRSATIALTDGVMVALRLARPGARGRPRARAWSRSRPGSCSATSNRKLDELGLAFENLGDIDRQTLAGSISTGTHGTGARFRSVSAQIEAVELVLADGSSLEISAPSDPAALARGADRPRRARDRLRGRRSAPSPPSRSTASTARGRSTRRSARLDELNAASDHFEFYVFPHTETALCRESRRTDEPPRPRPRAAASTPRR